MIDPKEINVIFYHDPCQDGLAAAWVAKIFSDELCKTTFFTSYLFVGMKAGSDEIFPEFNNNKILFLDCAPSEKQVIELNKVSRGYYILDHHKTNKERFEGKSNVIFDMNKSGVGIAWNFFFPEKEMPIYLKHIQDRDLWTWEIPYSKEFCEALFFYVSSKDDLSDKFSIFDSLDENYENYKKFGELLVEKKNKQISHIANIVSRRIYYYLFWKVCIANVDYELVSDLGNKILKNYDFDFVVLWNYDHVTELYNLSLRANGKVDVSAICKTLGGGGHPNAAGCGMKDHPHNYFSAKELPIVQDIHEPIYSYFN